MALRQRGPLSRRKFCFCCMTGAAFAATGGWLTPRQAFAEARGLVTLIKDSAARQRTQSTNFHLQLKCRTGSVI
jgi:hypothetical protein